MHKNKVQFKVGVSFPVFIETFGTEEQCSAYLESCKWPVGFNCDTCDSD